VVLSALKRYLGSRVADLTAVVTVTDDGGSSGRLREELRVLPPGDIRNCLVALAEVEPLMGELFQFRFGGDGALAGHSFGNLFLTALTGVTGGDFLRAIRFSSEVLAILGRIYPATLQDVRLEAITDSGDHVRGESRISQTDGRIRGIALSPPNCRPVPAALAAIRGADAPLNAVSMRVTTATIVISASSAKRRRRCSWRCVSRRRRACP